MTTILKRSKTCKLCSSESLHAVVGSTNTSGQPDLDTRPAEMMRSTIKFLIQKCPECGYCAPDISKGESITKDIVESNSYQDQLHDTSYPELANSFLCYSLLLNSEGKYTNAAWACIRAAWVCDDDNNQESAKKSRLKAIDFFQLAKQEDQMTNPDQPGAEEVLLADLHRRSGQFTSAYEICEEGLMKNPEKLIVNILEFQKKLIKKKDMDCYTLEDISVDKRKSGWGLKGLFRLK